MDNILSEEGSIKFKNLIVTTKNMVPNSTKVSELNKLKNALIVKKNLMNERLESSNVSPGTKNTIRTYCDDIEDLINLVDERIDVLGNSELGRGRGRGRKSRRKSTRKPTRKSTKKSRRKSSRK